MTDGAEQPVRAAATVVLWRQGASGPEVLMGQRGAAAAFMPSKYVFPGGAVDPGDTAGPGHLTPDCARRLTLMCPSGTPDARALIGAGLREFSEETGLALHGAARLRFVFRAITPPGRARRFDARFFVASARDLTGPAENFAGASDELSHLHWVGLVAARRLDLPFVTEVVLAEVTALLAGADQPGVPFFDNSGSVPVFRRIG